MVTVTVLADNTVATPVPTQLRGEWGFAAAVGDVLFDAGKTDVAARNARALGFDAPFETIVLSHAHFDHTGGLEHVLDVEAPQTVYCHPDVWAPRYSTTAPGGVEREEPVHIGLPYTRAIVESRATVREHDGPVEVAPGTFAIGEIPRPHVETTFGWVERDGELLEDRNLDDQALAVRTVEGTALVVGCCHAGLENSVEHAETVTGEPVRYVVGGTHLVDMDRAAVADLVDRLGDQLELFAGCHCTGAAAQSVIAERLPDAARSIGVGSTVELPPVDA